MQRSARVKLSVAIENWPFAKPLRTAVHTIYGCDVVVVSLEQDGLIGRGEAAGVFYRNENPFSLCEQIEQVRSRIESGADRETLQGLLPAGGARNALDCALWDLDAKRRGMPAWQLAGLAAPRALKTTFTCGADDPSKMAEVARSFADAQAVKLKLTGEPVDAERVKAVREARPDVWLCVDANQAFTLTTLTRLMPALLDARVQLIEQPFAVGQESLLDGLRSPIAVAADESAQQVSDLPALVGRFDLVNIKLDKCGGLTEGLAMARTARTLGLEAMVGSMAGTSLGMAPAFLVGQLCKVVDLDCPVFLQSDRAHAVSFARGCIDCPPRLWGT